MITTVTESGLDVRCHGSGTLVHVLTPTLDRRDPAFAYVDDDCPGCPDCAAAGAHPEPGSSSAETPAIPF
jgi:hypothetical protein